MEHPFHAAILDRYLMADSPERVTFHNGIGAGLLGFACETPEYYLPSGARRVLALRLTQGAQEAFAALAAAELGAGGMILSLFKENSFGPRWYDGETWIGPEPAFSHVWEQGFPTVDAALAYADPWRAKAGDMVEKMVDVAYALEPGFGYGT
jgi:hypothetical protein